MMELPTGIHPNSASLRLIDFGGVLRPSLGGKIQRVNRLGNRYAMDVTLPPLPYEVGRQVVSRLIRAKSEGLRMAIPAVKGKQGAPGSSLVNGAVTGGTSVAIDGLNAGYAALEGYWLSLVVSGQHYVHNVAETVVANGSGQATLTIAPELRVALPDNAVVNLAAPMIEGLVVGDELRWEISLAHHIGLSFSIEEAA